MKTILFPMWLFLNGVSGIAQEPIKPPVTLDIITKGLAEPFFAEVPELTDLIQARGIDFDLDKQLGAILSAASTGKRDPEQVAALVMACVNTCQACRMRVLAPMTSAELRTRLARRESLEVLSQEVRVRGMKDLEVSDAAGNALRAQGADDALIKLLIPDDKIPAIPIDGYTVVPLEHAEEYDPLAPAGWLKVVADVPGSSKSDFIFKHNGLFVRAKQGSEPTGVGAYFTKPAPRRTAQEFVDYKIKIETEGTAAVEEKRGGIPGLRKAKIPKPPPMVEVSYLSAETDGRNAFQIIVTNQQMESQPVSFVLHWQILPEAKPMSAAGTKN